MNSELTHSEIILRIEKLSNFENIYDPTQLESNMEEINDLVKILIQNN